MAYTGTEVHLVRNFEQSLQIVDQLQADAVILDLEGTLIRYVGEHPTFHDTFVCARPEVIAMREYMKEHPDKEYAIATNNPNNPVPRLKTEAGIGIVEFMANDVLAGIANRPVICAHKGMSVTATADTPEPQWLDNILFPLDKKPTGSQTKYIKSQFETVPRVSTLLDDQFKNIGEAVKGEVDAIIIAPPVGRVGSFGRIEEHGMVMLGRLFDPLVFSSMERRGIVARVAVSKLGGVDLDTIKDVVRHY